MERVEDEEGVTIVHRTMAAAAVIVMTALLAPLGLDAAFGAEAPSPTPTTSGGPVAPATPSPAPEVVAPSPSVAPTPAPTPSHVSPPRRAAAAPNAAVAVPSVSRISTGPDAYGASVRASTALFPGGAPTVILVSGAYPVFAPVAASLASSLGAAVLYVQPTAIPSVVMSELRRLTPSSIILVGGAAFLSDAVLASARSVTPNVTRIGGANVYETARLVFDQNTAAADAVYLADALTMDDMPQAALLAASHTKRLFVVNARASLDAATIASLRSAGTRSVVIVESTSPVSTAYAQALTASGFAVTRISKADRYSLSATVGIDVGASRTVSILVNPDKPLDMGLAAVVAALTRQPLYYTLAECNPDGIAGFVGAAGRPLLLVGDTNALTPAVASNAKCSTQKQILESALNAAVRTTLSQWSGSYVVTVRQLGGLNQVTQVNGGLRMEPASMMKIFAAWAAYRLVEQGRASLKTVLPSGVPLETCIQIMIHVSDNYCHTDIVHWIGIPTINSMIRAAGFTNTVYGNVPRGTSILYAGNRTTTNDLTWLMQRLADRSILGKTYSDLLITHMRTQIWRSRIASGIPPGVPQASKPGALWISSGLLQADTAIVNGPRTAYVLSIIGVNQPPVAALQAISRAVYTQLNGAFGNAASYPVQQMVTATASVLRTGPGGGVYATIPAGVYIQVLDAQRVWYQIQYGSRKLWVYYTGLRNR